MKSIRRLFMWITNATNHKWNRFTLWMWNVINNACGEDAYPQGNDNF